MYVYWQFPFLGDTRNWLPAGFVYHWGAEPWDYQRSRQQDSVSTESYWCPQ